MYRIQPFLLYFFFKFLFCFRPFPTLGSLFTAWRSLACGHLTKRWGKNELASEVSRLAQWYAWSWKIGQSFPAGEDEFLPETEVSTTVPFQESPFVVTENLFGAYPFSRRLVKAESSSTTTTTSSHEFVLAHQNNDTCLIFRLFYFSWLFIKLYGWHRNECRNFVKS